MGRGYELWGHKNETCKNVLIVLWSFNRKQQPLLLLRFYQPSMTLTFSQFSMVGCVRRQSVSLTSRQFSILTLNYSFRASSSTTTKHIVSQWTYFTTQQDDGRVRCGIMVNCFLSASNTMVWVLYVSIALSQILWVFLYCNWFALASGYQISFFFSFFLLTFHGVMVTFLTANWKEWKKNPKCSI